MVNYYQSQYDITNYKSRLLLYFGPNHCLGQIWLGLRSAAKKIVMWLMIKYRYYIQTTSLEESSCNS